MRETGSEPGPQVESNSLASQELTELLRSQRAAVHNQLVRCGVVAAWRQQLFEEIFMSYSMAGGSTKPCINSVAIYDYDTYKRGFSMPNLVTDPEMWVAVFAVSSASDPNASIAFVPFLRVSSYTAGTATFSSVV